MNTLGYNENRYEVIVADFLLKLETDLPSISTTLFAVHQFQDTSQAKLIAAIFSANAFSYVIDWEATVPRHDISIVVEKVNSQQAPVMTRDVADAIMNYGLITVTELSSHPYTWWADVTRNMNVRESFVVALLLLELLDVWALGDLTGVLDVAEKLNDAGWVIEDETGTRTRLCLNKIASKLGFNFM